MSTPDQLDTTMSNQDMVKYFAPFTLKAELEIKSPTFSETDVESPRNALELDDVAFAEWPHIEGRQSNNGQNYQQYVKGHGAKSDQKECSMKLEFPKLNFSMTFGNINLISKLQEYI